MNRHIDIGSYTVIGVAFILFIVALFVKGFTHDLLLEAGVFLVSLKLIIMCYKSGMYIGNLHRELRAIKNLLREKQKGCDA